LGWWLFSKDKLKEAFKGMLALIGWLLRRLCELEGRIKELEQLRHRLEGRLALNSTNSGKLPLTDGLAKAARKSLRTKSGRRPGGQPGPGLAIHAQFAELADRVGAPVPISTLNSGLIAVVDGALRERETFEPPERTLIERVVARCQAERQSSKWWVSSEIDNLLEIASQRGIGCD